MALRLMKHGILMPTTPAQQAPAIGLTNENRDGAAINVARYFDAYYACAASS
jgi:hypothetical protein